MLKLEVTDDELLYLTCLLGMQLESLDSSDESVAERKQAIILMRKMDAVKPGVVAEYRRDAKDWLDRQPIYV